MRRVVLGGVVGAVVFATPALSAFLNSATAASTLSTTQLAEPTGLGATAGCTTAIPKLPQVTLSWTATTTTFATGYDVYRAVGAGPSTYLATVTPRTTITYVDTTVAVLTTYTYTVKTRYASWSKASATASATTAAVCL
ncbi:MAG: hypothetical protein M3P04_11950 [Actinomycetota bacterium]|nr:hypothetical protein [Actinomycetota bacterium]